MKKRHTQVKNTLAALLVGLALLLCAVPALAAQEDASALKDQLAMLKRVHIQHEWLPDIRTNESAVQKLLDLFLACDAQDIEALTDEETKELRAYFEALYTVQGKNTADVDALFSQEAPPEVSSSGQESSSVASSAKPTNSAPSYGQAVVPGSAATSAPAPAPVNPPQTPAQGGGLGFFANSGVGSLMLTVLFILAGILFLRFLAALRRACGGKAKRPALPTQDMFGEIMEDEHSENSAQKEPSDDAQAPQAKSVFDPPQYAPDALPKQPNAPKDSLQSTRVQDEGPQAKPKQGRNPPDMPNSIAMHSFAKQPRTGRPAKMPFRQGDATDIDAIDE